MDFSWLNYIIPSIASPILLYYIFRKPIETALAKGIEHKFNKSLEELRAELRSKENEIAALRSGALSAMASRQIALDKRRIEAVDQLWQAVTALEATESISSFMATVNFDAVAKEVKNNKDVRNTFSLVNTAFGIDPKKIDVSGAAKAFPFVSPMVRALFAAYEAITMDAVLKLQFLSIGFDANKYLVKGGLSKIVKSVLPQQTEEIDRYEEKMGYTYYHLLLVEIKIRLVDEIQSMLEGVETDRASMKRAAEIIRDSRELKDSLINSSIQQTNASN